MSIVVDDFPDPINPKRVAGKNPEGVREGRAGARGDFDDRQMTLFIDEKRGRP
jgi:hypothetical protein